MTPLRDPFIQFLINTVIAFTSLLFSALSVLISQQITGKPLKNQEQKLPRTGPLARERSRKVWAINILAIFGSVLMIIYCSLETIDTINHPESLYAWQMTILFVSAGIGCIMYLVTRIIKIIQGEPKISRLMQENKEMIEN